MRTLTVLLLALTLVGCAGTKKIVETSRTDTHTITQETTTERETTLTITTEEIDTTVTIAEQVASVTRPLDELLRGDTISASQNGTSVQVFLDQTTGNITAIGKTEEQKIPVKGTRTTKTRSDRDSRTDSKSDTVTKEREKTTTKEKEPWFDPFWVLVLILILGAIFLLYRQCRQ